jgi:hypothetical protein
MWVPMVNEASSRSSTLSMVEKVSRAGNAKRRLKEL